MTFPIDKGYLDWLALHNNKQDRYEAWRRRVINKALNRSAIRQLNACRYANLWPTSKEKTT